MKRPIDVQGPPESVDASIARLASKQFSAFSRGQAIARGASRTVIEHRLREGRWERVHPGVYRLAGVAPSWQQSAFAALLAAGRDAAVCRNTAATVLRLPDFTPIPIELVVAHGRRRRLRGVVVHESRALSGADTVVFGGIKTTNATRTLIDLAGNTAELKLEIAVDDALRRGLTSIPRLDWRLDALGGSGRPGTGALRAILEERVVTGIPQSPLETRVLAQIRTAGIELPMCQYQVWDGKKLLAVLDFAWPDRMVAVEADGYAVHSGRPSFEHDRQRSRALVALGWRIVSITARDLEKAPAKVIAEIARILAH